MGFDEQPKTRKEYWSIVQLSPRGISSDFLNFLSFRMSFENIATLKSIPGQETKAKTCIDSLVASFKKTPTYSERYLNDRELQQAAEHGVRKEDLVNAETETVIKRLDEIALRFRQIGAEMTEENYQNFAQESYELYGEALTLVSA